MHPLDVASPPTRHGRRLRALAVAKALRGGGEERLYTRLGVAGGGPVAFAQPEHATAASTQNSGWVGNLSNNNEIHAIEQCKFANRPRARARPRSID